MDTGPSTTSGVVLICAHAVIGLPFEVANLFARPVFNGDLPTNVIADTQSGLAAVDWALHLFDLTDRSPAVALDTTLFRRRHATKLDLHKHSETARNLNERHGQPTRPQPGRRRPTHQADHLTLPLNHILQLTFGEQQS